ncbi:hypothetical protein [Novosphingobium sp.]|uniref:hypothetical protein n=1 Tax=Novosphingobium sp. TaxID=1874826 RepID=UPI0025E5F5A7|nr:hypothetical protein [Novosphingobium sp.]MCC6926004.1 hypothetical protein [Novosphingobium sp.]
MLRRLFMQLWLLCGTLDALYASALTLLRGNGDVAAMWRGVAAGPFGAGADGWGLAGSLTGLAVHFAIMAVMIAVGIWLARQTMLGEVAPWKAGTLYGLILYAVMYGIVLHLRFGAPFPNPDRVKLALGLFPHVFFVGLPIFYLVRRTPRPS